MRYYSFAYPVHEGDVVETWSEDEVKERYYPHWYSKMCKKYGKEHVDANYCFEDCLDDWQTIHWAWKVED